jgi:hypothetical protein
LNEKATPGQICRCRAVYRFKRPAELTFKGGESHPLREAQPQKQIFGHGITPCQPLFVAPFKVSGGYSAAILSQIVRITETDSIAVPKKRVCRNAESQVAVPLPIAAVML